MKDQIVNPVAQPSQAGGVSYASALSSTASVYSAADLDGFMLVNGRKAKTATAQRTICGKKAVTTDSKLRPMPRRLTAFVGRLHIDTTEHDLREFLSAAGTVSPVCKRLVAKDGRKFKTAAFMVSCDATS